MRNGFLALVIAVLLLTAGCSGQAGAKNPSAFLPKADAAPGWSAVNESESYNTDNLFNLVDGQAESFFAYGFEQVAVQRYKNNAGTQLFAEIWQLGDPADAYGLFTSVRAGQPANYGNEGDTDAGRRIAFWQDRYFAQVNAAAPIPEADLAAFARAIADSLPKGGQRPTLVQKLPAEGLMENAFLFFHEELSIQNDLWLGGQNILGLSADTNGLLAKYQVNGKNGRLLVVEYPDEQKATAGLRALQSGGVDDLLAARQSGKLLAGAFGKLDPADGQALVEQVLR